MTGFKKLKDFISYFNSPFVRPKMKFYFGKIAIGTPHFFPRKSVKNPDKPGYYKFIPKKIGFDIVTLGWKTKFGQYRFEWSPVISFVFFKWQIAVTIVAPEQHQYWESWLYYKFETKILDNKLDRAHQCQKEYPQKWKSTKDGISVTIDYYDIILKKKYRIKNIDQIREDKLNKILK